MRRHLYALATCAVLLAASAGCSSSDTRSSTVATSTTAAMTTTTTTSPPTTSAPVGVDELVLLPGGIGPYPFGTAQRTVVATLDQVLGNPTSTPYDFTVPGEPGYQTADGEYGFVRPFAEERCYIKAFCVTFGGTSAADAVFVGWRLRSTEGTPETPTADLLEFHDPNGLRLGMRGTDPSAAGMYIPEGGCYTTSTGTTKDGVKVEMISDGVMFMEPTDSGEIEYHTPPPEDVVVIGMHAGDEVWFMYADC